MYSGFLYMQMQTHTNACAVHTQEWVCPCVCEHTHRPTDTHADRVAHSHTDMHTDTQTDKYTRMNKIYPGIYFIIISHLYLAPWV